MIVPEWIWGLLGATMLGLIGTLYKQMLTKSEHAEICKSSIKEVTKSLEQVIKDEIKDVKDYFDIKIENVVLKEIRKINNKGC